jgi:hypothetical protein
VTPIRNLPDYVENGGRQQVYRHPYTASGVTLLGLVVPACSRKIDAVLDRDLNGPSGGAVHYASASPDVVITFTAVKRLASRDRPDSDKGYLTEREVAIWCLAADRANKRLVWYPPYILPDSDRAMTAGREVYGYPKQVAFFDRQYRHCLEATGGDTVIKTMAIECYDSNSHAKRQSLCTLHRTHTEYDTAAEEPGDGLTMRAVEHAYDVHNREFAVHTDRLVRERPPQSAVITVGGALPPRPPAPTPPYHKPPLLPMPEPLGRNNHDLVTELATNPTVVFLKQFRDVTCPGKACYQAVIEAPLSIHHIDHGTPPTFRELPPDLLHLSFPHLDSHPIEAELGIRTDESPVFPSRAFEINHMTFDILTGLEVWRAPT